MRVMIVGAGGNAGNNAARCLWQEGHWTLGVDPDPLMLELSDCQRTERLDTTAADPDAHIVELNLLIEHHGIDFVWAQPDPEARFLAACRRSIAAAVCVPPVEIVDLCQDKLDCARALGALAPVSGDIYDAISLLASYGDLWMRLRRGAGSSGALPVSSVAATDRWYTHWRDTRGIEPDEWMLAEVLPGRDLSWTAVYSYGELVISVAKERLSLLGASRSPANVASTATAQQIVHRPDLNVRCEEAIRRVSREQVPHGVFMVDAREDRDGVARITEVNAGRFGTTMDFFAACGPNLMQVALEVGTGTYSGGGGRRDEHQAGATWLRNTDCIGRLAKTAVAA
jgi:carbamoyl-phosphate synthase large subunit